MNGDEPRINLNPADILRIMSLRTAGLIEELAIMQARAELAERQLAALTTTVEREN